MFITLGQRVLMEKLLQTMSSPQGNRVVDTKQYCFSLFLLALGFSNKEKNTSHSQLELLLHSNYAVYLILIYVI